MCRSIKPLFNYEPEVTEAEIKEAALQFVRKVSGFRKPSKANEKAFIEAVESISENTVKLMAELDTKAQKRDRVEEIERAKLKNLKDIYK